jgi:hypothetical protein
MEPGNTDAAIVEGYAKLLDRLSPVSKLNLIARLTDSIKSDMEKKLATFEEAFGAWQSEETAEELIAQSATAEPLPGKPKIFEALSY